MKRQREIKKPKRYGDWEEGVVKVKRERVREKLWEIDDILERRGEGGNEEVLVKWRDWVGPADWVRLEANPELRNFLQKNQANPTSCSLVRKFVGGTDASNDDIIALQQAIHDSLCDVRRTPDGSIGRQSRVTVKLPFREAEFNQRFRGIPALRNRMPTCGNVDVMVTVEEMDTVFGGSHWSKRGYTTSTETFVSNRDYIHLGWGFKERKQYNHDKCKRCHWQGEECNRPELCSPELCMLLAPPWQTLTFTRSRRNLVTGDICRKRKRKGR